LRSSSEMKIWSGGDVEQRAFARALADRRKRARVIALAIEATHSICIGRT